MGNDELQKELIEIRDNIWEAAEETDLLLVKMEVNRIDSLIYKLDQERALAESSHENSGLHKHFVTGSTFLDEEVYGITDGKKYEVVYDGKDEIGVINDFGENREYSKNCFKEYYR